MKKVILIGIFAMGTTLSLMSCRETKEKTVVIEKEAEEEKGVLEKAGEKVDEEVNEEIDETIDKIGDDN